MSLLHYLCWFYWNPPREAFTIPFFDHPVFWYGILFVTGFILAYYVFNPLLSRFLMKTNQISTYDVSDWNQFIDILHTSSSPIASQILLELNSSLRKEVTKKPIATLSTQSKQSIINGCNQLLSKGEIKRGSLQDVFFPSLTTLKQTAYLLTDRLCWFVVAGTIIGARLGAVFFYDWSYFSQHPSEIIKIWHGGLASHGGVLGVMIAIYFYVKQIQRSIPQLTFLQLIDLVAIPSALVAFFIRIGNLINQEIIGNPTTLHCCILFGKQGENGLAIQGKTIRLE